MADDHDEHLRQQCTAIDTQKTLAEAYESQLTEASLMLHRLQDMVFRWYLSGRDEC